MILAGRAATRAEHSIFRQWWLLWWPARACGWRNTGTGRREDAAVRRTCWRRWELRSICRQRGSRRRSKKIGIGFLFAPAMHAATRHASEARDINWSADRLQSAGAADESGERVGAMAGVYDAKLTELVAGALGELGVKRAMVVHGADGLDEISMSGETFVSELRDGKVRKFSVTPEDFGLTRAPVEAIRGGDAKENTRNHPQNSRAFVAVPRTRSAAGYCAGEYGGGAGGGGAGCGFPGWSEDRGGIDRFRRGARKTGGAGGVHRLRIRPAEGTRGEVAGIESRKIPPLAFGSAVAAFGGGIAVAVWAVSRCATFGEFAAARRLGKLPDGREGNAAGCGWRWIFGVARSRVMAGIRRCK